MKVGIDSISFDIPKIHLTIKELAKNRNIEPEKLIKGLGLSKMSFLDIHQDVVTLAANAPVPVAPETYKPYFYVYDTGYDKNNNALSGIQIRQKFQWQVPDPIVP